MKTERILGVVLCVLMLSVTALAQEVFWEIKLHNSQNTDIFEREVSAYVDNGYVPLGVTYDGDELYILYVEDPDFGILAWSLEWYDNRDSTREAITANMEDGYIPTGVTYTGDMFYVLYAQVDSSADAWQLIPSGTNFQSVQQEIQPYVAQGYLPSGITALGDEYWTLLLHIPGTSRRRELRHQRSGQKENRLRRIRRRMAFEETTRVFPHE